MRTGLIVFGVILLAIGGIFYFIPQPTASATTTGNTGTSTSSASLSIPWGLAVGIIIVGFVFMMFGFALPSGDIIQTNDSRTSYDVKTSKDVVSDDGRKRRITHERHVRKIKN